MKSPAVESPAVESPASPAMRIAFGFAGVVLGLIAGAVLLFGTVVMRAHVQEVFLYSSSQLLDADLIPTGILVVVLGVTGYRNGRALGRTAVGGAAGLAAGVLVGAAAGALASDDPAWPWAGGVIGAAAGMLIGMVAFGWFARRRLRGAWRSASSAALLAALLACAGPEPPEVGPVTVEEPSPEEVETVLFLVGDAGAARFRTHPILSRIRLDVNDWSGRLDRDSAVAVLLLGDIIYPDGLDQRWDDEFSKDSAFIADQAALVADTVARRRGARVIFVAGNHDWGSQEDWEGTERLQRLQDFLEEQRTNAGLNAYLAPVAGTGGPGVLDLGRHLRIIMLDTAWWIFGAARAEKDAVLDSTRAALADAGDRRVVLAAHHPLRTGGPHGIHYERSVPGLLRALLSRSGAWLQDVHSPPYRDLLLGLDRVFGETRPPDVFAAGHEHSAQVLRGVTPKEPPTQLVLGSASKLTPVGGAEGMVLGVSQPAYARLFILRDGTMRVFFVAAEDEHLDCPEDDALAACLQEGVAAYDVLWGDDLPRPERQPAGTLRH